MDYLLLKKHVLEKRKGTFRFIEYERQLTPRQKYRGNIITKRTSAIVRIGVNYNSMKSVMHKRANGTLPAVGAGLKYGSWMRDQFPYFIEHNNTIYLRVYPVKNCKTKSQLFLNGKPVELNQIYDMLLSKDRDKSRVSDVLNIKIDNIMFIR